MNIMGPWSLRDAFVDLEGRTYEDKDYFANAEDDQEFRLTRLKNNFKLFELLHNMYLLDDKIITDHISNIYGELMSQIIFYYTSIMEDLSEDNPWKKREEIRRKKEEEEE